MFIFLTCLVMVGKLWHNHDMTSLHMITFRCSQDLFDRLERFAKDRNIDRTSVLKLALHYYLNSLC